MSAARLLTWPVRHPVAALGVTGVCTALAIVGVTRLRISPSLAELVAADDPAAGALAPGPAGQALSASIQKDPLRLHEFLIERLLGERPFKTWQNGDAFISEDGRSILIRISGKQPPSDLEFSKRFTADMTKMAERANS